MKKFFKSDWFKCITTLLVLAVFFGGLLAILSDVLYVSPEERTMRAVKKIYGEEKEYTSIIDVDNAELGTSVDYDFGKINKLYEVGDKASGKYDLLFQTEGFNGYKGGTITMWTKVIVDGNKYSIEKVMLESFTKQTLMSKLDGSFYGKFVLDDVTEAYRNGQLFTPNNSSSPNYNPVSGATYSATAGNNAVNCVIKYVGEHGLSDGTEVQSPTKEITTIPQALMSFYGSEIEYSPRLDIENNLGTAVTNEYGKINKILEIKNSDDSYDIIFNSTGNDGYSSGSVTLWSKVTVRNSVLAIDKVLYGSSIGQSRMDIFTREFFDSLNVTDIKETYTQGNFFEAFDQDAINYNPVTGATYTANAANRAINCIIKFLGATK